MLRAVHHSERQLFSPCTFVTSVICPRLILHRLVFVHFIAQHSPWEDNVCPLTTLSLQDKEILEKRGLRKCGPRPLVGGGSRVGLVITEARDILANSTEGAAQRS